MFCRLRRTLYAGLTLASLGLATACGGWHPVRTPQLESHANGAAAYSAVQQVLADGKYHVIKQSDPERKIVVRSHIDEDSDKTHSFITIVIADDGKVSFTPSGYLVKTDGRIHRKLNAEIDDISQRITDKLASPQAASSNNPVETSAPTPASSIALAWNEPAYDPKIWGPGDFTCLPVKIPTEDQAALKLKLSTGEEADLVLSIAYAPELCRSPKQCPIATGCPALGFGDVQQVNQLAQKLVDKSVGPHAIVLNHEQPIATIDLTSHGLIAKAISQIKPPEPPPAAPTSSPNEKAPESKAPKAKAKASGTAR
jgi:hypothetical protein